MAWHPKPTNPSYAFNADHQVARHPDKASGSSQSQLVDRCDGTTPLAAVQPVPGGECSSVLSSTRTRLKRKQHQELLSAQWYSLCLVL